MNMKEWKVKEFSICSENQEIANKYLESIQNKRSGETLEKYRYVIEKFLAACPKLINEITSDDVWEWFVASHEGYANRSKNVTLAALSSFFIFCRKHEYLDRILVKSMWFCKKPRRVPKFLDHNEQARVKMEAEKLCPRDRAIVEFLISSGCRRSELWRLNIEDIDLENRTVTVLGKGNKLRDVGFSVECAMYLKEYLNSRMDDEPALLINKFGGRLSRYSIYKIIANLGKKAALKGKLSPHRIRHTYGYNLLHRGVDIEIIADELGHSDINTTRIYTSIPTQELIREYDKRMGLI